MNRNPDVSVRHSVRSAGPIALLFCLAGAMGCGQQPDSQSTAQATAASESTSPEAPRTLVTADAAPLNAHEAEVDRLIQTLTRPGLPAEEWEKAHEELLALKQDAAIGLAKKLTHGTDVERELAAMTLALLGSDAESAADALESAMQDKVSFVRANATAALLQIPDRAEKAIPALLQLLDDADPQIRQLAAMNLGSLGEEAAPFVDELRKKLAAADSPETLTALAELLGRIGTAAKPAIPELQKVSFSQPDEIKAVVQAAIEAIEAP